MHLLVTFLLVKKGGRELATRKETGRVGEKRKMRDARALVKSLF